MTIQHMSVEEMNDSLKRELNALKSSPTCEKARELALEMNEILYSVIEHHAPQVNAVKVATNADVDRECRDLPDWGYRERLKSYLEKVLKRENLKGSVPYEFVENLPFSFTTGTHGSGERAAMGSSIENVQFEVYGFRPYTDVGLCIDLGLGHWLFSRKVRFVPQEIESIKLDKVSDKEFSPMLITDRERGMDVLKPHRTAVEHYLFFKGFCRVVEVPEKIVPEGPWKKDIVSIYGSVLVPEYRTGLLRVDYKKPTLTGFAAQERDGSFVLYGFENAELPEGLWKASTTDWNTTVAAYFISLGKGKLPEGVTTYSGDDIISRLHDEKTERTF